MTIPKPLVIIALFALIFCAVAAVFMSNLYSEQRKELTVSNTVVRLLLIKLDNCEGRHFYRVPPRKTNNEGIKL